jgi:hypothetical protein
MRQVLTVVYPWRKVGIDGYLYLGVAMSTEPATGDGSAMSAAAGDTEMGGGGTRGTVWGGTEVSAGASGTATRGTEVGGGEVGGGEVSGGGWAPDACTLPTAERPFRAADFDAVFAATVRDLDHIGPTRLHLELEPSPQAAARMAELAAAETGCCSFFTFALTATGGALTLDITVPQQYAPVLAALADRARAVAGRAS